MNKWNSAWKVWTYADMRTGFQNLLFQMKGTESPELKSLNSSFKYLDGNVTDTTNALNWPHWRRASTWRTATYPQCFMFWGLSMRMASFILSSSGQPLVTAILWSSHCLGLLGVGWSTTWKQPQANAWESDALRKRKQKINAVLEMFSHPSELLVLQSQHACALSEQLHLHSR